MICALLIAIVNCKISKRTEKSAKTNMKNPYGIDENGRYTTVNDLAPSTQYGLACNLVCPECGRPLVAVRTSGRRTMSHLAHHADDTDCTGYGESASHALAKEILLEAAERHETFVLPPVFVSDAVPHAKLSKATYRHAEPKMKAIEVTIESVYLEHDAAKRYISGSKIPDAVMEFSYRGRRSAIAVEISNTHAKSIEDVREYAEEEKIRGVVEIDVSPVQPTPENAVIFRELLRRHIMGYEKRSDAKYWLYNPKMREQLDEYELCIYVDLPEGMYQDPYSVVTSLNMELRRYCEQHGAPEHFHITTSCPAPTRCIDNIVHDRFRGNAYNSMPGYMTGIIRSVWAKPSEAKRLSVALAKNPVPYSRYESETALAAFQDECVESFKKIVEEIASSSRKAVLEQYDGNIGHYVVNDIVKTREGHSVTDRLPKSRCPKKRICLQSDAQETPSDGRALVQCVEDCQFCRKKKIEKIGSGYELHWTHCAYPGAYDDSGRLKAGYHKTIEGMKKTIEQARYVEQYMDEEKRRRGTRRRKRKR